MLIRSVWFSPNVPLCIMEGRTSSPWSYHSEGNCSRGFMVCSALSLHTKLAESDLGMNLLRRSWKLMEAVTLYFFDCILRDIIFVIENSRTKL